MHTLARFEFALGRRLQWGFMRGHQLKVAPHAFSEANAFYSEEDQALLFGYFPSLLEPGSNVFTCLSHDVVVHETAHALIDGLRTRYTDPSSPDQAAFHEGFADVVALLSIFALPNVAELVLDMSVDPDQELISAERIDARELRRGFSGLADQVGAEIAGVRGQPLRRSLEIEPRSGLLQEPEFMESHRRGEILSAAMMSAFINVWAKRLERIGQKAPGRVDRWKVAEEGAAVADSLLTSAIRALDYVPPVDVSFNDYLSAFVTADSEIRPGTDDRWGVRQAVVDAFGKFGIAPASNMPEGVWEPPEERSGSVYVYDRTHFEPMQRDADEVFHFIWENRSEDHIGLDEEAFTYVQSVRPCVRVGPDGFMLRETVAEYIQVLKIQAGELDSLGLTKPDGMPGEQELWLYGGGALIFDEYGKIKFHISNRLRGKKQNERLKYLYDYGFFAGKSLQVRFSSLHRLRSLARIGRPEEGW
ncbi:MAG TPA: hypothetical protein VEU30_15265, partial [Thermoanaerobaculia bacterium]|nr:hypothetical protein [Thermoanaerobaculia bacterium]